MNTRRSLSQALQSAELPPEAEAVIREGSPAVRPPMPTVPPSLRPPAVEVPARPTPVEPPRSASRPRPKAAVPPPRGLVTLSVRVRAPLADALLRIAFERKLQRDAPCTQQDIVVEAVTQWIQEHGYDVGDG